MRSLQAAGGSACLICPRAGVGKPAELRPAWVCVLNLGISPGRSSHRSAARGASKESFKHPLGLAGSQPPCPGSSSPASGRLCCCNELRGINGAQREAMGQYGVLGL